MSKHPTITLDLTNLDRNQTFALTSIIGADTDHVDDNTEALLEHIGAHVFRWVKEAERENDFDQVDFYENVLLPDDYNAPGIWYDQIGNRYDHNTWTYSTGAWAKVPGVYFDDSGWLDADSTRWDLVEEAAKIYIKDGVTSEVEDIATTLGILTRNLAKEAKTRPSKQTWLTYITEFACENYGE